jgi:hypothetical protein
MDLEIHQTVTALVALVPTVPSAERRIQPVISRLRRRLITLNPTTSMGIMVTMNQKQYDRMLTLAREDGHNSTKTWLTAICATRSGSGGKVLSSALDHLALLSASPTPDVAEAAKAWRRKIHRSAA